jgi:hypothetical protein
MRDASLATIQGCVLLGTLCFVDGESEAEALYYAAALRLGLILDLSNRPCATELERQINLRGTLMQIYLDFCTSFTNLYFSMVDPLYD